MAVKDGYRQSDVGVIPNDWDSGLLEHYIEKVGSGITPTGGTRVYQSDGRPFVRSQNVGWGHLILDDIAFINDEIHKSFESTEIKINDVLLNITGASIGRSAIADARVSGGNVNQHVCIIRTNKSHLNPLFLNRFLLSRNGQTQIDSFQAGGNRQGLNFGQVKSFQIPLPPRLEQEAIAAVLGDVDDLINSLERLIAKKRDVKQGAMQELLSGKKRLEGFSEEWEVKKLGDIGECIIGLTYRPENVKESGLFVLRSSNIQNNSLDLEDKVFVDLDVNQRIMIQEGDILICVRNGSRDLIGKCTLLDARAAGMTFGAFMSVFRTSFSKFVLHQLQSDSIKKQIHENIGATINQITNKNLNSFEISFPTNLAEQQAITAVLSDLDAEIAALEGRLLKTRALKTGMMQDLLTGRIRLV